MNFTFGVLLVAWCLFLFWAVHWLGEEFTFVEKLFLWFGLVVLFVPLAVVQIFWASVQFNGDVFRFLVDLCVEGIMCLLPPWTKAALARLEAAPVPPRKDKKWSSRHSFFPKCAVCFQNEACVQAGRGKKSFFFPHTYTSCPFCK
jgi:hypothetical protein